MAETDLTFTVVTGLEHRPVDGGDSIIFALPSGYYVDVGDGALAFNLGPFMRLVRSLAEKSAANLGCQLHHGEFWVTKDPELMREKGMMHDCPDCQDGMTQTLAYMATHPETEMVVGQLWWAG